MTPVLRIRNLHASCSGDCGKRQRKGYAGTEQDARRGQAGAADTGATVHSDRSASAQPADKGRKKCVKFRSRVGDAAIGDGKRQKFNAAVPAQARFITETEFSNFSRFKQ